MNGICYFFGNISFWKCMDHHNWKRKIDKGKFIFFFTAVEFQTDHFELFKLSKKNKPCCLFFWSSISFWFPLEEFIFTNISATCCAFLRFCLVWNVCTGKMNAIWTISVCWALEASVLFFVYACTFLLVFFSAKTIGVLCNFNCRWCVWGQCLVVFFVVVFFRCNNYWVHKQTQCLTTWWVSLLCLGGLWSHLYYFKRFSTSTV